MVVTGRGCYPLPRSYSFLTGTGQPLPQGYYGHNIYISEPLHSITMPELSRADRSRATQILPRGHSLDVDRRFSASQVTTDLSAWSRDTSRMDFRGYDTRQDQTPRGYERTRAQYGRPSTFPVEEPERYFNPNSVTRNLLETVKNNIYDYDSFKLLLAQAWQGDNSLRNLIPNMAEEDYNALFRHQVVKDWVDKNLEREGTRIIGERNRIDPQRALQMWQNMNQAQRINILGLTLPPTAREIRPVTQIPSQIPQPEVVTWHRADGTAYQRSKGAKWTDLQLRFLLNRRGLPSKRVVEEYNSFWRNSPRSDKSVKSKFYRLPRLARQ